jgi:hypothetical protein
MKLNQLKQLIKEAIQTIFEADLQYNEGDRVEIDSSYGGSIGTVVLSKHPFYGVKFDKTGTTQSFHFSDLRPFDDEEEEEKNADIDTGLDENILLHENIKISSNFKYHLNKKLPLNENIFRYGSDAQLELFEEARQLYSKGLLYLNSKDRWLIENTDIGEYGEYEGKLVPLDIPMEDGKWPEEIMSKYNDIIFRLVKTQSNRAKYELIDAETGKTWELGGRIYNNLQQLIDDAEDTIKPKGGRQSTYLGESKDNKPLGKPLGKPMRDSSGGKAYKVYVKDPKTKKVKTVRFGSGGLKAKINDPKARQAFAKRHNCARKNDKTKASYWSCRLPRYAQALGLKSSFSGFW